MQHYLYGRSETLQLRSLPVASTEAPSITDSSVTTPDTLTTNGHNERPPAMYGDGDNKPLVPAPSGIWLASPYPWLKVMFLDQWVLSLLHFFTPLAMVFRFASSSRLPVDDLLMFLFACLGLVPLSERLGFILEQLSHHVGEIVAAALSISLSSRPELVVTLLCVYKKEPYVATYTLAGATLSSLLLVCGAAFFIGGLRHHDCRYNTQLSSALLMALLLFTIAISVISSIPSQVSIEATDPSQPVRMSSFLSDDEEAPMLIVSRIAAVVSLLFYFAFSVFMLVTHKDTLHDEDGSGMARHSSNGILFGGFAKGASGIPPAGFKGGYVGGAGAGAEDEDAEEDVNSLCVLVTCLLVVLAFITILSDAAIDAIEGAATASGMTQLFMCGVILPTVGNVSEMAVAIRFGLKKRFNLVIAAQVGAAAEMSLFLLPITVLADWASGGQLGLNFANVMHTSLLTGVLAATIALQSGRGTWMHGLCLVLAYVLIACAWFFQPKEVYVGVNQEALLADAHSELDSDAHWVPQQHGVGTGVRHESGHEASQHRANAALQALTPFSMLMSN